MPIRDSAFEDEIFNCIPADDLIERHVLELRYFHFQRANEIRERKNYNTICLIHFQLQNGNTIPVLHRSYYLESLPNGSIWLSLCTYTPYIETPTLTSGQIINNTNGKAVQQKEYQLYDNLLLSPREKEVLMLLAKGHSSKQIADILNISTNTVYRHRQNILSTLQVSNTAAAIQVGFRLNII